MMEAGILDDLDAMKGVLGLSDETVERVRRTARETDQRWVPVVAALGFVEESKLAAALAAQYRLPLLPTVPIAALPQSIAATPSKAFLRARRLAPFGGDGTGVDVALADPGDAAAVRALVAALGVPVRLHIATLADINDALDQTGPAEDLFADLPGLDPEHGIEEAGALRDLAERAPIIRLVDQLLAESIRAHASDLHLESCRDHVSARLRVDGQLRPLRRLPRAAGSAITSRLKVLAGMDVANRRAPQDGRTTVSIQGRQVDLRLSSVPGLHGETISVRFLDRTASALDLHALGFATPTLDLLCSLTDRPHGLVLVTGPTGHGKTTTLYSMLRRLNDGTRKILTIEDPVEYELEGVTQVQVNEAAGVSFASALRAFLRQDPDVLLVGEIRDGETARIAAQAALTGHVVLATLHTNDAPSAVTRLRNMGLENYLMAGVISGVLAQRLVRTLCSCALPETDPRTKLAVERIVSGQAPALRRALGCSSCGNTGYFGRVAIAEAFLVDEEEAAAISLGGEAQLRQALGRKAWAPLQVDGAARAARGETDWREVLRVSG